MDMELNWNSAANTRAWAQGYTNSYTGSSYYYNFGDAAGCPPYGLCSGGWTQEDIYQVSWGYIPAYSTPEIYCLVCGPGDTRGGNAAEWEQIALYGNSAHGVVIQFTASFTQWAAAGNCCTNRPDEGWTQLQNALNSQSVTQQTLLYSTDITKAN
jgi:hypothetical protein